MEKETINFCYNYAKYREYILIKCKGTYEQWEWELEPDRHTVSLLLFLSFHFKYVYIKFICIYLIEYFILESLYCDACLWGVCMCICVYKIEFNSLFC